jgi:hypothetical protein
MREVSLLEGDHGERNSAHAVSASAATIGMPHEGTPTFNN